MKKKYFNGKVNQSLFIQVHYSTRIRVSLIHKWEFKPGMENFTVTQNISGI